METTKNVNLLFTCTNILGRYYTSLLFGHIVKNLLFYFWLYGQNSSVRFSIYSAVWIGPTGPVCAKKLF